MVDVHRRAAFFDRDGTIIKAVAYLSSFDQIAFIEGSLDLCRFFQQKGYLLILVTNQSGIARGFFDEGFVQETHEHLFKRLAVMGIHFIQAYYCSHHPNGIIPAYTQRCECRKPGSGMLRAAAREHNIDLKASVMIGDSACDMQAGKEAGCRSFEINEMLSMSDDELVRLFDGFYKQTGKQQGKTVN